MTPLAGLILGFLLITIGFVINRHYAWKDIDSSHPDI